MYVCIYTCVYVPYVYACVCVYVFLSWHEIFFTADNVYPQSLFTPRGIKDPRPSPVG